ncbi:hypothetical protein [Patulibacter americanus]|uniref:hypothetical protein n=1 Tax=Patulibacter americanus TaxID=588672 RepID=UPI0003B2ECB4|nr:hypothetical protein [Patulibacter americanus]
MDPRSDAVLPPTGVAVLWELFALLGLLAVAVATHDASVVLVGACLAVPLLVRGSGQAARVVAVLAAPLLGVAGPGRRPSVPSPSAPTFASWPPAARGGSPRPPCAAAVR